MDSGEHGDRAPRPSTTRPLDEPDRAVGDDDLVGPGVAFNASDEPLTLIVDAANVIGARPDGWWRDRAAAALRLYDDLLTVAERRLPDARIIMVVEGAARVAVSRLLARPTPPRPSDRGAEPMDRACGTTAADRAPSDQVRRVQPVAASGSGDDEIARLARDLPGRRVVVTADRDLRRRCRAVGAGVVGPGWLRALL